MSNASQSSVKASLNNGLILALFALFATGLIVLTHAVTKQTIKAEVEAALVRKLADIIPQDQYDNAVYTDCIAINAEQLGGNQKVYRMRKGKRPHAIFLTVTAADGYAGAIAMVMGIYHDASVAGLRITQHQETPGLGDKIELAKDNWVLSFNGKSLSNPAVDQWAVKKDGGEFDAFTGATITPRAVVNASKRALQYYQEHRNQLFDAPANCE